MRRLSLAAAVGVAMLFAPGASAETGPTQNQPNQSLTIERLVASPSLDGPRARGVVFSPDGSRVTYLKAKADDAQRTDLWEFDLKRRQHRLLADSNDFAQRAETEAERARRERQRIRDTGIVDYAWSQDGKALLFPIGGDLYSMQLGQKPRRLTNSDGAEIDARFAPDGRRVSYVRDGNLYVLTLDDGKETALTEGAKDGLSFGGAEFAAQEELGRFTGYWWSPDSAFLAYARVDDSNIPAINRYDYGGDGVKTVPQRYPFAGGPNAKVTLLIRDMAAGKVAEIDLGDPAAYYLARADWRRDGSELLVQRLSRDQKQLDLLAINPRTGAVRTLLTEQSSVWINLHNDLRPLQDGRFLWASERSGYKHLYLYSADGKQSQALTTGDWPVAAVVSVNEKAGEVVFEGFADGPLEQHVYSVRLDQGPASQRRWTQETGWHSATVSADGKSWLHGYSGLDQPPQLALRGPDGRLLTWLEENRLDDQHPYAPYRQARIRPRFGTINAQDGTPLHYMMLVPPGAEQSAAKRPAIVFTYGGPHVQLVTHRWPSGHFQQLLAQHGYVVFTVDNRGSTNRGVAFEAQLYRSFGKVEVQDQKAGAEFLASLPYVDARRIGIFGSSYGGFNTLMALTRAPDTFAAGVAGAPVTDWRLYDTAYTERYLGLPSDGTVYDDSSVFRDLGQLKAALLVIHGMADDNVFFDNTVKLALALQKAGRPFEMMTYPGERHGFQDRTLLAHNYRTILDFFDRRLKGQ